MLANHCERAVALVEQALALTLGRAGGGGAGASGGGGDGGSDGKLGSSRAWEWRTPTHRPRENRS